MWRKLGVGVALVLGGCASSGPTGSQILTGSLKPQSARLVIYRPSPLGFAVQPDYLINGQKVGTSQSNGFIVCEYPPGPRQVAVSNPEINVSITGGSSKLDVVLKAGTTTYLQAQPQIGLIVGVITLTAVTEAQGRADAAQLHKTEATCAAGDSKPAEAKKVADGAAAKRKKE
jgi:Protein of unknown function (DUF2846)